jgi:fatty acid desaturase
LLLDLCLVKSFISLKKLKIMKPNMSSLDRSIRTFVAIALAALAWMGYLTGTWGIVAYIVATVFLMTSFFSFCPLYAVLGISSCPIKNAE